MSWAKEWGSTGSRVDVFPRGQSPLKAHFPPLSDYRVQQLLEQSSLLCSSPFCLNGTLAAEGQQLLWKHKTLACYKYQLTFWTWNPSWREEAAKQTQGGKNAGGTRWWSCIVLAFISPIDIHIQSSFTTAKKLFCLYSHEWNESLSWN